MVNVCLSWISAVSKLTKTTPGVNLKYTAKSNPHMVGLGVVQAN